MRLTTQLLAGLLAAWNVSGAGLKSPPKEGENPAEHLPGFRLLSEGISIPRRSRSMPQASRPAIERSVASQVVPGLIRKDSSRSPRNCHLQPGPNVRLAPAPQQAAEKHRTSNVEHQTGHNVALGV